MNPTKPADKPSDSDATPTKPPSDKPSSSATPSSTTHKPSSSTTASSTTHKSSEPKKTSPATADKPSKSEEPCTPPIKLPGTKAKASPPQAGDKDDKCELGKEYVVYPKDSKDKTKNKAIFEAISEMVIRDSIYTSDVKGYGVIFWRAVLTPTQADDLLKHPGVGVVYGPCSKDKCQNPSTVIERQPQAQDDPVVVGQFPENDLFWYRSSYIFDSKAGKGVPLYILDGGAMLSHFVRNTYRAH